MKLIGNPNILIKKLTERKEISFVSIYIDNFSVKLDMIKTVALLK